MTDENVAHIDFCWRSFNKCIFFIRLLGKFVLDLVDGHLFLSGSHTSYIRTWIGESLKAITVGDVGFNVGDWIIVDWIIC